MKIPWNIVTKNISLSTWNTRRGEASLRPENARLPLEKKLQQKIGSSEETLPRRVRPAADRMQESEPDWHTSEEVTKICVIESRGNLWIESANGALALQRQSEPDW